MLSDLVHASMVVIHYTGASCGNCGAATSVPRKVQQCPRCKTLLCFVAAKSLGPDETRKAGEARFQSKNPENVRYIGLVVGSVGHWRLLDDYRAVDSFIDRARAHFESDDQVISFREADERSKGSAVVRPYVSTQAAAIWLLGQLSEAEMLSVVQAFSYGSIETRIDPTDALDKDCSFAEALRQLLIAFIESHLAAIPEVSDEEQRRYELCNALDEAYKPAI